MTRWGETRRGEATHETGCRASATLGSPIESCRRNVCGHEVEWNWKQAIQTAGRESSYRGERVARRRREIARTLKRKIYFSINKLRIRLFLCRFVSISLKDMNDWPPAGIREWHETLSDLRMNFTQHAIPFYQQNLFELYYLLNFRYDTLVSKI
jgi:hypothetical protein